MYLKFNGSATSTIGLEIELLILDAQTLELTPQSESLLDLCDSYGLQRVKAEIHQSMIEIDSEISANVKECREFLRNRMRQLHEIAEEKGLKLAIMGTHPTQRWTDRLISKNERYQYLHEKYQWLARRMNVCGMHVHVGVEDGKKALAISQVMIRFLPHLLALSANSPFWQGIDTGMHSSRVNIMESFPGAGLPILFNDWKEFNHYYHTLKMAGTIISFKDFYWFIRPNPEYGTIEFRICDAMSSLDETMSLVALIHCLVVWVSEGIEIMPDAFKWSKEQHWLATENQWIAARDGLSGLIITNLEGKQEKIADEVLNLVNKLSPIAVKLDCFEELQGLKHIIINGNGAEKQRKIYDKTQSFKDVISAAIREYQLSF
ncbi:MAG: YbdK family carboxylate-amine ligase [Chlamydiales bacterium]|nr:YbdK family carboxylate-amine ligase [Chlamydiales bacterium]